MGSKTPEAILGLFRGVSESLGPSGSTPQFQTTREAWLQNITQEKLLDELTHHITSDAPRDDPRSAHRACFNSDELTSLRSTFEAHCVTERGVEYWSEDALTAFLSTKLPPECTPSLLSCSDIIFSLVLFFSTFPFLPTDNDILTMDAFIRSIAFLTARRKGIFNNWRSLDFCESTRTKTDSMFNEDLFRSLSRMEQSRPVSGGEVEADEDVVDILAEVQPTLNGRTVPFLRDEMRERVEKISRGKVPIGQVEVEKDALLALFNCLQDALQGSEDEYELEPRAKKKLERRRIVLRGRIEAARLEIGLIGSALLSLERIVHAAPDAFFTIAGGIAVMFSVLIEYSGPAD